MCNIVDNLSNVKEDPLTNNFFEKTSQTPVLVIINCFLVQHKIYYNQASNQETGSGGGSQSILEEGSSTEGSGGATEGSGGSTEGSGSTVKEGSGSSRVEPLASCEGLAAGTYPHPDCDKYYKCAPGWPPSEESCAGDQRYNHNIKNCDWPHNVPCQFQNHIIVIIVKRIDNCEKPYFYQISNGLICKWLKT